MTLVSDGGGQVVAPLHPIHGAADAARLVATLLAVRPGAELTVENVNSRAGLVLRCAGRAEAVVCLDVSGSLITHLWIVLNPDKLAGWHHSSPSLSAPRMTPTITLRTDVQDGRDH